MRYVYGPVASRRLGSSLGLDIVTRKVRDSDCICFQLGRASVKTLERKPYVPADAVLRCIARRYCTLADVPAALGADFVETSKVMAEIEKKGDRVVERRGGDIYYRAR